ncbi:GntR family transcriptional regulator [Paraburkholderia xenovorans]|uniref:GntR family transcriptional regulator n=1 Tax=Paraburkholderia xenovorans TaxID=36873 RepID=UPI0038B7CF73
MATTVLGQQPRYMQLAQTLLNEIQGGQFPIGTLLPTEFELCEQFGASRFTVRQAIKQLEQRGLVDRRPGIGTRVKATQSETAYRQVMERLSDLHRYTTDTELEIASTRTVEIDDPDLIERLGAKPGETWLLAEGIRLSPESVEPICHTEVYIHPAFRSLTGLSGRTHVPIYTMIEKQFGEQIAEVQQEIRAVALPAKLAQRLNAKPRSPALWLCRRYLNRRAQVVELTISVHPADRYSYSETFQRDWHAN